MANPQIEDGHTRIANQLVEALAMVNLSAYESRVLWCIFRKTYGWNKKTDRISYSQFAQATRIDRRHIGRAILELKRRKIITCSGEGYNLEYGIQKDFDTWIGVKIDTNPGNDLTPKEATITLEKLTPIQGALTPIQVSKLTPKEATTKDNKASYKRQYIKDITVFIESLRAEFPDIKDFDTQVKNCDQWHADHHPGNCNRYRKSALRNWMTKERRDAKEGKRGVNTNHIKTDGATTGPRRTLGSIMRESDA